MRTWITSMFLLVATFVQAQCLSGNCQNGQGRYDFGYAIYTGAFVNGLPDGIGTMDYGGGRKYTGAFSKGAENGKGLLYDKDGKTEEVRYANGNIVIRQKINVLGAAMVEGCKTGDCSNGYGEASFPSGNSYAGNFVNGKMQGQGKFVFASGNVFEGLMKDNVPAHGKFTYHHEKVVFNGDFNPDGTPMTGVYRYIESESSVTVANNVIVKVNNPLADALAAEAKERRSITYAKCPACAGKGITGSAASYSYTTPGTYTMSQFGQGRINLTNPVTHTSTGRTFYSVCSTCKGAKQVPVK